MFRLSINALDKSIFDGQAEFLTLPGAEGELTILENHLPLVTPLKEGKLSFKTGNKEESLLIKGGVLEVGPKKVIVLVNI
jgi:F-type H+-transporting ATPase subunit epsilon